MAKSRGRLHQGDVLVSNFNNSAAKGNLQGTGTTIVEIDPHGGVRLFAQIDATKLPGACPGGVGLTAALVVLRCQRNGITSTFADDCDANRTPT